MFCVSSYLYLKKIQYLRAGAEHNLMSESKLPSWSCCIIMLVCLGKKEGIAFSSSVVVLVLEVWLLWGRNLTLCHGPAHCGCTFTKVPVLKVEETVFSLCGPKSDKMNTPGIKTHFMCWHHLISVQVGLLWLGVFHHKGNSSTRESDKWGAGRWQNLLAEAASSVA